jgi:hypothetical protein
VVSESSSADHHDGLERPVNNEPRGHPMGSDTNLALSPVSVRIKISALWASMLFVFAYVDLFSLYRPDVRADLEAGELGGFTVDGPFLVATTAYVVIPSLMVFLALVVPPRANRIVNFTLSIGYALTISAGAIGEWGYYILGSAVEVALLAAIGYYAWTWPKGAQPTSTTRQSATGDRPPTHS